jgi:hypothetical protein
LTKKKEQEIFITMTVTSLEAAMLLLFHAGLQRRGSEFQR